jgi:hypothetical protein
LGLRPGLDGCRPNTREAATADVRLLVSGNMGRLRPIYMDGARPFCLGRGTCKVHTRMVVKKGPPRYTAIVGGTKCVPVSLSGISHRPFGDDGRGVGGGAVDERDLLTGKHGR